MFILLLRKTLSFYLHVAVLSSCFRRSLRTDIQIGLLHNSEYISQGPLFYFNNLFKRLLIMTAEEITRFPYNHTA